MSAFTVTHIDSSTATCKNEHGQTVSLPLSCFSDHPSVGSTTLIHATLIDRPLTHTLAHAVLTELLNPPTP